MKAIKLVILCISIFLSHNVKAQQSYYSEYDSTIDKLIPKAKKNKLNEKKTVLLASAYHQANEKDHKRIMELKASGQPDIWIEIYFRINNINTRQNKIKTLPDNVKKSINFMVLNLDNEINNSKEKAELYICAKTNQLLKNPTSENLAEASVLANTLQKINPQNNKLDDIRLKLVILPSKNILFRIATPKDLHLPENFAPLALDFNENTIYGIPFDIIPKENTDYDLMIRIMILEKKISPERVESITFEEKNGENVAKVTDKTMSKTVSINGKIEFIDVKKETVLITTPFDIGTNFIHQYAEISGSKEACSEKTLELLTSLPIDFPSNEALLKDVARKLNSIIKSHYQKK